MIVGATDAPDATILQTSADLYARARLRRVYFSAYSPDPERLGDTPAVGAAAAPRAPALSGRLAHAVLWIRRAGSSRPAERPNLELEIDPKLRWALSGTGRRFRSISTEPSAPCSCGFRGWVRGTWIESWGCGGGGAAGGGSGAAARAAGPCPALRRGGRSLARASLPDRLDLRRRIASRDQLDLFSSGALGAQRAALSRRCVRSSTARSTDGGRRRGGSSRRRRLPSRWSGRSAGAPDSQPAFDHLDYPVSSSRGPADDPRVSRRFLLAGANGRVPSGPAPGGPRCTGRSGGTPRASLGSCRS